MPNPDGSPTAEELAQLQAAEYGIPPANVVNAPVTEITSDAAPSRSLEDRVEQGIKYLKKLGTPFGMVPDSVGKPTPAGPKGEVGTASFIPGDSSMSNEDVDFDNAANAIGRPYESRLEQRTAPQNINPGGQNVALFGKENLDNATKVYPNAQAAAIGNEAETMAKEGDEVANHWKNVQGEAAKQLGAIQHNRQQFLEDQMVRQKELEDRTAKYTANLSDGKAFWKSPANVFGALVTSLMPLGTMSVETSQKIINNAIQQDFKNRQEVADGHLGALRSNLNGYRQLAGDKVAGDYLALGESYKVAAMELERISASFKGEHARNQAQANIAKLMEESAKFTMQAWQQMNMNPQVMSPQMQAAWNKRPDHVQYGAPAGGPQGSSGSPIGSMPRIGGGPSGQPSGSPSGPSGGPSKGAFTVDPVGSAVDTLKQIPIKAGNEAAQGRAGDSVIDRANANSTALVQYTLERLPPEQRRVRRDPKTGAWVFSDSKAQMAFEANKDEAEKRAMKVMERPDWAPTTTSLRLSQRVLANSKRFEQIVGRNKVQEAFGTMASLVGNAKAVDFNVAMSRFLGPDSSKEKEKQLQELRQIYGDFAYLQSDAFKQAFGATKGDKGFDNDAELASRWADTRDWTGFSQSVARLNENANSRYRGLINSVGTDAIGKYARQKLENSYGNNSVGSGYRAQGRPKNGG